LQQKQAHVNAILRTRSAQDQRVARLRQKVEQDRVARTRSLELQKQIEGLQQRLGADDYASEPRAKLHQLKEQRALLQSELDNDAFAAEARAALARTQAQLAVVGYDSAAHDVLKGQLQELADAEANYRDLEMARVGLAQEAEALSRLDRDIRAQNTLLESLSREQEQRYSAVAALQPYLASEPQLKSQEAETRRRVLAANSRVAEARQNLSTLDTQEQRQEASRAERDQLLKRSAILSELKEAFGVNGIPAMIIEHTLPELEREANRILQQLTGGRMHLRFETQRELRTGDTRETLDIIISDEKGTRPYENFSGGEQFRVNFAIRVALSRLLSQRAGVRLRSLFIDEGFGVLDADGRQRLVEAVMAIQDEFDLILVITHIEELRESFPTQIQVTKTDGGSLVEVI
jgi:exonuclease SbcC